MAETKAKKRAKKKPKTDSEILTEAAIKSANRRVEQMTGEEMAAEVDKLTELPWKFESEYPQGSWLHDADIDSWNQSRRHEARMVEQFGYSGDQWPSIGGMLDPMYRNARRLPAPPPSRELYGPYREGRPFGVGDMSDTPPYDDPVLYPQYQGSFSGSTTPSVPYTDPDMFPPGASRQPVVSPGGYTPVGYSGAPRDPTILRGSRQGRKARGKSPLPPTDYFGREADPVLKKSRRGRRGYQKGGVVAPNDNEMEAARKKGLFGDYPTDRWLRKNPSDPRMPIGISQGPRMQRADPTRARPNFDRPLNDNEREAALQAGYARPRPVLVLPTIEDIKMGAGEAPDYGNYPWGEAPRGSNQARYEEWSPSDRDRYGPRRGHDYDFVSAPGELDFESGYQYGPPAYSPRAREMQKARLEEEGYTQTPGGHYVKRGGGGPSRAEQAIMRDTMDREIEEMAAKARREPYPDPWKQFPRARIPGELHPPMFGGPPGGWQRPPIPMDFSDLERGVDPFEVDPEMDEFLDEINAHTKKWRPRLEKGQLNPDEIDQMTAEQQEIGERAMMRREDYRFEYPTMKKAVEGKKKRNR